jgi:O-antigen ligase
MAGILEGLLGIYQFLFRVGPEGFVLFGRYMRAYGTFLQPNPFGGYLGLSLPLAYAIVLIQWRPALEGWRHRAYGVSALWALAVAATAVMSAALVMSWSRGALLGAAAGAALVLLALGRRAWGAALVLALVALLLAPGLVGGLPTELLGRVTDASAYLGGADLTAVEIDDDNFAIIERLAHWQAAWRMFSRQPWLGVGPGQYATVYPEVALPRWADPLGHAHNYYLNVLAEGGLVGLAGYLVFVAAAITAAWRAARHAATPWARALGLGALGMLGHLLAHSAVDNLYVHEMYLLGALILGLAAALAPTTRPSRP